MSSNDASLTINQSLAFINSQIALVPKSPHEKRTDLVEYFLAGKKREREKQFGYDHREDANSAVMPYENARTPQVYIYKANPKKSSGVQESASCTYNCWGQSIPLIQNKGLIIDIFT